LFDALVNDVNAESDFDQISLANECAVSVTAAFVTAGPVSGSTVLDSVLVTVSAAAEQLHEAFTRFSADTCLSTLSVQWTDTSGQQHFLALCLAA